MLHLAVVIHVVLAALSVLVLRHAQLAKRVMGIILIHQIVHVWLVVSRV